MAPSTPATSGAAVTYASTGSGPSPRRTQTGWPWKNAPSRGKHRTTEKRAQLHSRAPDVGDTEKGPWEVQRERGTKQHELTTGLVARGGGAARSSAPGDGCVEAWFPWRRGGLSRVVTERGFKKKVYNFFTLQTGAFQLSNLHAWGGEILVSIKVLFFVFFFLIA